MPACTTRSWPGGCWASPRTGSAPCWSASGIPPTARSRLSSGPTGARWPTSSTAGAGSGRIPARGLPGGEQADAEEEQDRGQDDRQRDQDVGGQPELPVPVLEQHLPGAVVAAVGDRVGLLTSCAHVG